MNKKKTKKVRKKNPLYVVKKDRQGKVIEEAKNILDLIIKKFNLAPFFETLMQLMAILLENIQSYPAFLAVKEYFDLVLSTVEQFLGSKQTATE